MEKIYSTKDPENLLHVICRKENIQRRREDFASQDEVMQVAIISFGRREQVAAHRHLENPRQTTATQEMIVVVNGSLEASFFDTNGSLLNRTLLIPGDCYVTYRGGHSFIALEENTQVYEVKNGPYYGKEKDKVEI